MRRQCWIVPVAQCDEGTAMHQFAGFADGAFAAVLAHHPDIGVGDRFADGVGALDGILRCQVGRAKGFGQAVHQIRQGIWKDFFDLFQQGCRHMAAGIGEATDASAGSGRPGG